MHIAAALAIHHKLLPALSEFKKALEEKSLALSSIIKVGRTHLMDATPLTLGQEFSGYVSQVAHGRKALESALPHVYELAIGGTAVGTGINCPKGFAEKVIGLLASTTGIAFKRAENPFEALIV
jgi:fumarate hydratase, class II